MVFAKSEEEFKSMWDGMKTQLDGFEWSQLVEFDKAKFQKVIDARSAVVKK
jgi:multiple sugar transport system substrate-binding protein/putative aldouronate transport system substrate-binding protein